MILEDQNHLRSQASQKQTSTRLSWAIVFTLGFVILEAASGVFANSLVLLTDSAHNLTDVVALGLSWYAIRLTSQPANDQKTYGYHRAGILVAMVNSTTLVLISIGVFYSAYLRLRSASEVRSVVLIAVGLVAVVVNLITALFFRHAGEWDLNLRSVFIHFTGDVASTLGAVIAGVAIYITHANWLDPFVSILIGFLILRNAWLLLGETVNILLESTPGDVDLGEMVNEIRGVQGVLGVHDLHVWSLTRNLRTMSAHILTSDVSISQGVGLQRQINEILFHRYHIGHASLQLECVDCAPDSLYCDLNEVVHKHFELDPQGK